MALALLFALPPSSVRAQAWLDPAWTFRRSVAIANPGGTALLDYQVRIDLDASFDFSRARGDGFDLRLTDAGGTTPVPFWVEVWNPAASHAVLWAKVPSIPAGGTTLLVYYGNTSATDATDPHATFAFYEGFESGNAVAPLQTPTYDGSGQAMHPSIVHVPGGWHGYTYWMANTPYPYDNDTLENPSIIASNDGIHWVEPPGIVNPIAGPIAGGYNNDPELLLVNDKLVCWYNETLLSGTMAIRRMESDDGVHWTAPVTSLTLPNFEMSLSIVFEGGVYKMWYVASTLGCYSPDQTVYLRASTDGMNWGSPQPVTFDNPAVTPWHPEVRKDGQKYVMLVSCYVTGATCANDDLYYAESPDGLNWTFSPRPIIARSAGGWDNLSVYRTSFLVEDGFLRVWYSASSTSHVWGTAYVEGTVAQFLAASATPWDFAQGDMRNVATPVRTGGLALEQDGNSSRYPMLSKNRTGRFAVSAWLYDDLDVTPEHGADLRIWDPGNAQFQLHSVGVGFMTDESETHYATFSEGWEYTPTSIPRTTGWHRLTVAVADATIRLRFDDTAVASLSVLDEAAITRFSLEGDARGTSWFDDVYVREYVEPEPATAVGSEQQQNGSVAPITNLAASAVRSGHDASGRLRVRLDWSPTPAGTTVQVYRAPFGNYPAYGQGASPGAAPAVPAYPPPGPWAATGVQAPAESDAPPGRDAWYYVAFVTNGSGTRSPVSNRTAGTLDYVLGDVTDGVTPGQGDNVVDIVDVTLLGAHYGQFVAPGGAPGYLDVGPTQDGTLFSRPLVDGRVEFEDFVLFALNFGEPPASPAHARSVVAGTDRLSLTVSGRAVPGSSVRATLDASGSGALHALRARLAWNPAVVRPAGCEPGAFLMAQSGTLLSPEPGVLDLAVLGRDVAGLTGEGELARVTFEVLAEGDPGIRLVTVDARDGANRATPLAFSTATVPGRPEVSGLSPATPSPFGESTTFVLSLATPGAADVAIYSVDGRRVATLARGVHEAGRYPLAWNGRDADGRPQPAGVYYAQLVTAQGRCSRKLVLAR